MNNCIWGGRVEQWSEVVVVAGIGPEGKFVEVLKAHRRNRNKEGTDCLDY
jgi:hypothetical protein